MTNQRQTWRTEQTVETTASAEDVWAVLTDVPGWKKWNAGIEHVALEGPFAAGTWMTMKPPGQDAFRTRIKTVRDNVAFVDETSVGDLTIVVAHELERLGVGRTSIRYVLEASGPAAAEIGPAVAADFPEVLAALAALVEAKVDAA